MTKADEYLVRDINNILENGIMDVNPRPKYAMSATKLEKLERT